MKIPRNVTEYTRQNDPVLKLEKKYTKRVMKINIQCTGKQFYSIGKKIIEEYFFRENAGPVLEKFSKFFEKIKIPNIYISREIKTNVTKQNRKKL